jgi:ubiquinone/menaquinone biosynthesis C-methylase UbiE
MARRADSLRYFDIFLESFKRDESDSASAFGWHVHWGYWRSPGVADGSTADFVRAAEDMVGVIADSAQAGDGLRVLDVGCGFGGTVASFNARWTGQHLTGVNIDPRQIERARRQIHAKDGNTVDFVQADALAMPVPDGFYDVVLSIESICHFTDREAFFKEAQRVLRPGGRLVVVDFVPVGLLRPWIVLNDLLFGWLGRAVYGPMNNHYTMTDYRRLGQRFGLPVTDEVDATLNTVPSYPYTRKLMTGFGRPKLETFANNSINSTMQWLSEQGLLRYMIMTFSKPS